LLKNIGKYEIVSELGQGAMGIVYKARDPLIGRSVALKTITGGLADKPELLERFYQEARSAGALQHPNIVTIFELGKEEGTPFIAMEFIEGESLEKIIARRDSLALSKKIGYMAQICSALDYAHKHGVIHRDIKPANVMPTREGIVKVLDFGIARLKDTSKTQTGLMMGTPAYMSPQLLRGEKADERADIWALGVMLYEMVAYQRPFQGDNPAALMWNIISQQPRPLCEVAPGCPPELEEIVGHMLEKEATLRLQTMEDVLLELDPLYKRLQKGRFDELVIESRGLIQTEELQAARGKLIEALHLDSSNAEAKTLLDRVSAEIRRQAGRVRAKEQLEKAENLLKAGRLQEAKAEADSALRLDTKYEEAQQAVARIAEALDRVKSIQEKLQAAKQRNAEGSLSEADQLLNDVLALDPANEQAQLLRKQIREETARRERRKKIADGLQQARSLWSQLRHEECINVLAELQRQFPGESEVAELLTTVRHDHAEQQKQEQLGEARNLLAAQRYQEALAALAKLSKTYPSDAAVKHLTSLVQQEQVAKAKRQRFDDELAALRNKVSESQWDEALRRGEQLLKEFPAEFELKELLTFVRAEQQRAEQKRVLDEKARNVRALTDSGSFAQAVKAGEKALTEHPGDLNLKVLLESARTQQQEKEKREFLEKRIREVKARITRAEFTDAIDLARQTIVSAGPDTDISQLLHAAEMEMTQREKKKEQDKQVVAAETMISSGNFAGATRVLDQAQATQIFEAGSPRLQEARRAIHDAEERQKQEAERQKAQERERANEEERRKKQEAADKKAEKDRKVAADKKAEAAKKDADRKEAAARESEKKSRKPEPPAPSRDSDFGGGGATAIFSPQPDSPATQWPPAGTPSHGHGFQPSATTVGTATTVGMPSQSPMDTVSASATMIAAGTTAPVIEKPVQRPVEQKAPLPEPTIEVAPRRTKVERQPAAEAHGMEVHATAAAIPLWKQPIPLAIAGVALAAIIGVGIYMSSGKPQPASTPSQPAQATATNQAQQNQVAQNQATQNPQESAQNKPVPTVPASSPATVPTPQTPSSQSKNQPQSKTPPPVAPPPQQQAPKTASITLPPASTPQPKLPTPTPSASASSTPPIQAPPSIQPQVQPPTPAPTAVTPAAQPATQVAANQPAPTPALQPSSSESRPVIPSASKPTVTVASSAHQVYKAPVNVGQVLSAAYLDNPLQLQSYDVPGDAAAKGTSVTLLISVNEQGKVFDGRGFGGDPKSASAILAAAKASWSFTKPEVNGKSVKTSTSVTVKF
jgi:serine/threonine-protein kinase